MSPKEQLQVEVDTSWLYRQLAGIQKDASMKAVLESMADIEQGHAEHALEHMKKADPGATMPGPSRRAGMQWRLGKVFGYDYILSQLTLVEKNLAGNMIREKKQKGEKITGMESSHVRIIEQVSRGSGLTGSNFSRLEGRHRSVGGNALRAAVLGANDGLVSNLSLVMGVAGAEASGKTILITGIAGLLAGAISMALGEWLSVQSSTELYKRQIALEAEELNASPEQEQKELALLYRAKGMQPAEADALAAKIFTDKDEALRTLVEEELGIDEEELKGSAWEAALTSFFLFAIGAILPVIPFLFLEGNNAIYLSVGFSIVGLFGIGTAITLFTGRTILFSGLRQVMFGLAAAAITFGIGKLIGVSVN